MVDVVKRECKEDYEMTDSFGAEFTISAGESYITRKKEMDGQVMVFSKYWILVPVEIFHPVRETAS